MIVIANVFPILQTVKELVRPLSRKCRFWTSSENQNVKGSETLVKSVWEHFYHIFDHYEGICFLKISPLVKFEILGVFVNTLTTDDKYPVPDCENLQFPYLNAIILKTKTFFWIFSSIDGGCMKFQIFWKKKMIVIANVLRTLQTVNDLVGQLSKKRRFRTSFEAQQVRGSQSLAKSASEHFCHIFSSL